MPAFLFYAHLDDIFAFAALVMEEAFLVSRLRVKRADSSANHRLALVSGKVPGRRPGSTVHHPPVNTPLMHHLPNHQAL